MEEFELEPGESITRLVRRHWIILLGDCFPSLILAILPLLLPFAFVLLQQFVSVPAELLGMITKASPWFPAALAFWWLFLWITLFSIFTQYYLTAWIITTTRIVDIRQYGFFSREVSSFLLNRVQDVTTDVEGLFATMFGYGKLDVETAGRDEKFSMYGIQNPTALRDLIMKEVAALHADGQLPTSGV